MIGLTYYAEPQHHHKVSEAVNGRHRPGLLDGAQLGTSTMPKAPFASSASNSSAGTARAKWKP